MDFDQINNSPDAESFALAFSADVFYSTDQPDWEVSSMLGGLDAKYALFKLMGGDFRTKDGNNLALLNQFCSGIFDEIKK